MKKMPTREQAAKGWFKPGMDPRRRLTGAPRGAGHLVKTQLLEHRSSFVKRLVYLSEQTEDLKVALEATKIGLTILGGPLDTQHMKGPQEDEEAPLTEAELASLECPEAPPMPDNVVPMTVPAAPGEET